MHHVFQPARKHHHKSGQRVDQVAPAQHALIQGRNIHPNPRIEAVGARDHWAVEQLAGEPVIEPNMDRAIEALRKMAIAARGTR